jgi:hypothetical protein
MWLYPGYQPGLSAKNSHIWYFKLIEPGPVDAANIDFSLPWVPLLGLVEFQTESTL